MPIKSGVRLGSYEIVAVLGAGGMGEVYRARDSKLNRDVALKILPDAFASDPDRLARFRREAQTLASLNHPNIAQIHGLEEDPHALVMELVEGPDLAARIAQGPLPLDDVMAIGRQVADALEAAHEQGIVHRDLKPANIKVREDGTVKVLDFGLAKGFDSPASQSSLSMSPTLAGPAMTGIGMIMGTAAYMSPEQAKGKPVDKRADIWAFGVVLHEMLTGRQLFEGETMSEVLAAVIMRDPDLSLLPSSTPASLKHLIARCLVRDPKLRLRDIGEARLSLSDRGLGVRDPASGIRDSGSGRTSLEPRVPSPGSRVTLILSAALAIALAAMTFAWWRASTSTPKQSITRFEVRPPDKALIPTDSRPNLTLSPDGSTLAFVAASDGAVRIFLRARGDLAPRAIVGTAGATEPVFSPDGTQIAFFAEGKLKRTSLEGAVSDVIRISDTDAPRRGLAWLSSGVMVYSPIASSGLVVVDANGGTSRLLTTLDDKKGERTHRWPFALPGGKSVLFTVGALASPDNYDGSTIEAVDVATGTRHVILEGAASARYVSTGHLLFARGVNLFAVSFDVDRLTTSGTPVQVLQGINGDTTTGALHLSIAEDGTTAYIPGSAQSGFNRLTWVDRSGASQSTLSLPQGTYFDPRLSPDGSRVAVAWQSATSGSTDIWIEDLARNTFTRLSFNGSNASPVWSSDGKTLYYSYIAPNGRTSTIMRKPADGSRDAEEVVSVNARAYLQAITQDQTTAILDFSLQGAVGDVMRVKLMANAKPEPIVATKFDELESSLSPDGHWLAYVADETGRLEVYVRDMTNSGGRWQISSMGGEEPHWSPDGNEVYYRNGPMLMAVPVSGRGTFEPKAPVQLFSGGYDFRSDSGLSYAVDPKGGRFLMIRPTVENTSTSIVVVINWFDELRQLMTAKR